MNVKCQSCEKMIDRNMAFKVKKGNVNKYYCNENEYLEILKARNLKDDVYNKIYECFGRQITNSTLFKEINELVKIYGYEKIFGYVNDNMDYLSSALIGKIFSSEYAKIRYFAAILKNSLADYIVEGTDYDKQIYIEMPDSKYTQREKKRSIDDIEQKVGEGI